MDQQIILPEAGLLELINELGDLRIEGSGFQFWGSRSGFQVWVPGLGSRSGFLLPGEG